MSVTSTEGYAVEQDEPLESVDPEAESGSGGETLGIWTSTREEKLGRLATASYSNESEFGVPAGVVDTNGYEYSWKTQESKLGIQVGGLALDNEGRPLAGTATLEASGVVIGEKSVAGSFAVNSQPPVGVRAGQSLQGDTYNFRFSPSTTGLDFFVENVPFVYNTGTFQYGKISGTVSTLEGEPVKGESVSGEGASTLTNADGEWSFVAPGGSPATLKTLKGSYEFEVDPSPGEKKTFDVVYPLLTVQVLDGNFQPIEGAEVVIDGVERTTNSDGEVSIEKAQVKDYTITVMGEYTIEGYTINDAGEEYNLQIGPGISLGGGSQNAPVGSITLNMVDLQTQQPVAGANATILDTGAQGRSAKNGSLTLLTKNQGQEATVAVGTGTKRYESRVVSVVLPDEGDKEVDVPLERKVITSTF